MQSDQASDDAAVGRKGQAAETAATPPETAGGPAELPPEGADAPTREEFDVVVLEREQLRDRLLRMAAEFDNYRKRTERERRELAEWAASELIGALLPVVDDFERALGAGGTSDADAYRKGVELIYRQLLDVLARYGVKPIEALGADFDPHRHDAVIHEESPGCRPGEVIAELRRGYTMGDRLIRPAMVKVAKA